MWSRGNFFHRGPGRTGHAHGDDHNEEQVQPDVQQGGQHQEHHRGAAVAQGTQEAGQDVVQHNGGDPQKDDHNVVVGVIDDVSGGVHPLEDGPAEHHRSHGEQQGKSRC